MFRRFALIIYAIVSFTVLNAQWIQQDAGFDILRAIGHICAVDTNVVWAAAFDPSDLNNPINEYTKTINGGTNWQPGIIAGADSLQISMIYAINENLAYSVLFNLLDDGGKLMQTIDGGVTWNEIDSVEFTTDPKICYFWDENEGVVIADPDSNYFQIFTTKDAGVNWKQVDKINMPVSQDGELTSHQSFSVVGNTIWFGGVTNGKVFVSHDRGNNWSFTGTPLDEVTKVIFRDSVNGIVGNVSLISGSWRLYKTENAGLSWNMIEPSGIVNYYDICYVPDSPDAYISAGYSLSQSSDGGETWFGFSPPSGGISPYYTNLAFVNPTTGWAGGLNFGDFSGGIYKYHGTPLNIYENPYQNMTIDIYPNPGNGIFHIRLSKKNATDNATLVVYNLLGKQVFTTDHPEETINLSHLTGGIYLLKLMIHGNVYQNKLIIRNP